jgi:pimeloyl-ACP methyl ester carboxylesterase
VRVSQDFEALLDNSCPRGATRRSMPPRNPLSPMLRLVAAMTLATLALAPVPAMAEDGVSPRGVPYLTNRNRTGDADPHRIYGEARGELAAGYCDITEQRLDILAPVAEAAPFRVPQGILRVEDVRPMPVDDVLSALGNGDDAAAPVLYTHGFYIDFEKGCIRATELQESAGLEGRFLWFSWPSDGSLLNYTHDEADLYWSVLDLAEIIVSLEDRFGPGRVNLAGHSLGARGMVLAIQDIAARHPDVVLGDVVLLAPDMDFDVFARLLPRIRPVVRSITVYVAEADRPLALSETVHGYPRLGQTGNDVSRLEGVEVIDLSDLQVRSPTGHLYHVYNPEVGADMDQLLNEGLAPGSRRNVVQAGPNLWRLQRPE